MSNEQSQSGLKSDGGTARAARATRSDEKALSRIYYYLAGRAYSVIMFGALFCSLAVKFFHSVRHNCVNEYFSWILADVAYLVVIEVILAMICLRWPLRWVIRAACVFAAGVCTWSVMNAGWLIRTGTQLLPTSLLPLIRDPINALIIVGVNLVRMPAAAMILLCPSAVALAFFFFILARPVMPNYNRRRFKEKIIVSVAVIVIVTLGYAAVAWRGALPVTSVGMRYNSQLKALTSLLMPGSRRIKRVLAGAKRTIPHFDQIDITPPQAGQINHNVVIVVLEGVQYRYTSMAETAKTSGRNLTAYLASLADAGVEFANARSTLTHTTKALFSLLTGRYPCVYQDLAEAVPVDKPYAGLASILKHQLNFRTAFFQSAKGNFEARPGLVHNLGFDKFWARDDLGDPDAYLGYLGCDEFSMLEPIAEWIKAENGPFFLTILCSVTHDPYVVPDWFATPAKDQLERYQQTIFYTDKFIAALDARLENLALREKTIFCVISDHGEGFGEHGLLGHERDPFEEALRIPFCIRAPGLIKPNTRITHPVSSIDLTPTILHLLGFDIERAGFDGIDVLGAGRPGRRVYFSGWLHQSPAGFIEGRRKYIYNPAGRSVTIYDLSSDALESTPKQLPQPQAQQIAEQIISWQRNSIFGIKQCRTGRKELFGSWQCRWTGRVCTARYIQPSKN